MGVIWVFVGYFIRVFVGFYTHFLSEKNIVVNCK